MQNAPDVLNAIISKRKYSSYLEIGVDSGHTLNAVSCGIKDGVDPHPRTPANFHCTSNAFFEQNKDKRYDIIFVDGLHFFEQVLCDINNSLSILNPNGTIVVHDVLPGPEGEQLRENVLVVEQGLYIRWTGDAWKALAILRASRPDLSMFTIDLDVGFGIIRIGKQEPYFPPLRTADILSFQYYQNNRNQMLAVVSPADALSLF